MGSYGESMDRLLEELGRLPGVGRKTAERLAHHILRMPAEDAMRLAVAIRDVKRNARTCSRCCNVTETDPCEICSNATRDAGAVCVVERPRDVVAVEESAAWRGLYHVLGGKVSPLDGVGAEDLTIARLVERIRSEGVTEVVVATSPDLEGDGTALHVERALAGLPVRVTRIARGVPTGYALENASAAMLRDAFRERAAPRSRDDDDAPAGTAPERTAPPDPPPTPSDV
jgi:recombination protein RecR